MLTLAPHVAGAMRDALPVVAEETVVAVIAEVPEYAASDTAETRTNIEGAVQMALAAFVRLAEDAHDTDPGMPHQAVLAAAYELGRGEARDGRTMDALLAAYRIGARVAWRGLSAVMVGEGLDASALAHFAELVFAYIDELSAASVAGRADEIATSGRVRERYLERLAELLLQGADAAALQDAARRAGWEPPATLTAVLVPAVHVRRARAMLDGRTLALTGDLAGDDALTEDDVILLVPDAHDRGRARLLRGLRDAHAVVGPARGWTDVAGSFARALRARAAIAADPLQALDTEAHLAALLLAADPDALGDLRRRVLAPLADLRPLVQERLILTLRSWLLHQGRRDDVAAELIVHPQTVRYRMTQIRDLYGDRFGDPQTVLELVAALGTLSPAEARAFAQP
jgi:hypothetical protein